MNRSTHPYEQEEVMAYLDGELTPEHAATMAAHLEQCADCAALADDLRLVSHRMRAWQMRPSPETLTRSVISHMNTPSTKNLWLAGQAGSFLRRWGWQLACSLVVLLVLVGLTRGRYEMSVERAKQAAAPQRVVQVPESSPSDFLVLPQAPLPLARGGGRANGGGGSGRGSKVHVPETPGPMIARTAALTIVGKDFAAARAAVEKIVGQHGGYLADLSTTTPKDAAQTLTATLRIPAPQLDAALAELKKLGRAEQETQSGEDVSKQHTDLFARLKNARASEQRLVEILRQRPGKVSEVLEVEQEISRVREEIEQMDAERKDIEKRVQFATVALRLVEEYKEQLNVTPPSTGTRLRNALVGGYRDAVDSIIAFLLFLFSAGPSLFLWVALLFFPARFVWRRFRRIAHKEISFGA